MVVFNQTRPGGRDVGSRMVVEETLADITTPPELFVSV
jgi:hypothetical protein